MSRVSSSSTGTKRVGSYSSSAMTSHYGSSYHSYTPSLATGYAARSAGTRPTSKYSLDTDRGRPLPRTDTLSRRSESLSRTPIKAFPTGLSGGYSGSYGYGTGSVQPSSLALSRRKSFSQTELNCDLLNLHITDSYHHHHLSSGKGSGLSRQELDPHPRAYRGASRPEGLEGGSTGGYTLPRTSTAQDTITAAFKTSDRFSPSWERSSRTDSREMAVSGGWWGSGV
ncbi:ubiquitin carboxyl-terminal hydrolase 2-like [Callorhinchus milii]|uniref:ubiquitin carboxyl-terminal hydrolase 2-like n=1 Tax=Callorhinchus milii TaxID=7868 RepID=UPI001C3F761A|nr:ubiquitin carboxyl-terminal hydrolase 2-like [Callorhinchus milii]